MTSIFRSRRPMATAFLVGSALTLLGSSIFAAPRLQTGPDAEVSHDGLHRVDKTVMDAAWVKPDLDLRGYDKLMLVSTDFSYVAVDADGRRYVPGRNNDDEFYIDIDARARIEREMREAFADELSRLDSYEIVTEQAPGVLMLVAGVYDIVSTVPPEDACLGRCEIYLRSVGEATLAMELRDAVSGEILARVVDRRAAETAGLGTELNSVTVWREVRRLATLWSRRVRDGLEDIQSVDDL